MAMRAECPSPNVRSASKGEGPGLQDHGLEVVVVVVVSPFDPPLKERVGGGRGQRPGSSRLEEEGGSQRRVRLTGSANGLRPVQAAQD